MKILIIGFAKIAYMPYINMYSRMVCDRNIVHVICWNRDHEKDVELENCTIHRFQADQLDEVAKWTKIGNFLAFKKYVARKLKDIKPDKIVILSTLPAVILSPILIWRYKERYIFDYRDYTYERFRIFKAVVNCLKENSYATFISSDAFREVFNNQSKLYTTHNILIDSLQYRDVRSRNPRQRTVIRIAFWGFIRHEEINRKLIELLAGDSRFELHYYGREQKSADGLKKLCLDRKVTNVFFHGPYAPAERYEFAANTDIIHNIYQNDLQMQKAMGNKYYDGVVMRLPQICMRGSYMGQLAEKKGVGLQVELNEYFADTVWNYYQTLDWNHFEKCTDAETERIRKEYNDVQRIICGFSNG